MDEHNVWAQSIEADRQLDCALIALSFAESVRDALDRDRSASAAARNHAYGVVARVQDDVREKLRISRELNERCVVVNDAIEARIRANELADAVAEAEAIIAVMFR